MSNQHLELLNWEMTCTQVFETLVMLGHVPELGYLLPVDC